MRLSKAQWLQQSLALLTQQGPEVLKVDTLCRQLKVTKGSFYHHFKNRDAFVRALLEHWQQVHTLALIESVAGLQGAEKSHALSELVSAQNTEQELAMRGWALRDMTVAHFVSTVDTQRMQCIAEIIREISGDCENAALAAKLVYSQWLGSIQLGDQISEDDQRNIEKLLRHSLEKA